MSVRSADGKSVVPDGVLSVAMGDEEGAQASRWVREELRRFIQDPDYSGQRLEADAPTATRGPTESLAPTDNSPGEWTGSVSYYMAGPGNPMDRLDLSPSAPRPDTPGDSVP